MLKANRNIKVFFFFLFALRSIHQDYFLILGASTKCVPSSTHFGLTNDFFCFTGTTQVLLQHDNHRGRAHIYTNLVGQWKGSSTHVLNP